MPQQPPINTLCYNGQFWCGTFTTDEELLLIKMSDPTFQQHLNRYLESLGIPTQTYIQLLAHVQHVSEQRYQAGQHLTRLDYWLTCADPEVRIIRYLRKK